MVNKTAIEDSLSHKFTTAVGSVVLFWNSLPSFVGRFLILVLGSIAGFVGGVYSNNNNFIGTVNAAVSDIVTMKAEIVTITSNMLAYKEATEAFQSSVNSLNQKLDQYVESNNQLISIFKELIQN